MTKDDVILLKSHCSVACTYACWCHVNNSVNIFSVWSCFHLCGDGHSMKHHLQHQHSLFIHNRHCYTIPPTHVYVAEKGGVAYSCCKLVPTTQRVFLEKGGDLGLYLLHLLLVLSTPSPKKKKQKNEELQGVFPIKTEMLLRWLLLLLGVVYDYEGTKALDGYLRDFLRIPTRTKILDKNIFFLVPVIATPSQRRKMRTGEVGPSFYRGAFVENIHHSCMTFCRKCAVWVQPWC